MCGSSTSRNPCPSQVSSAARRDVGLALRLRTRAPAFLPNSSNGVGKQTCLPPRCRDRFVVPSHLNKDVASSFTHVSQARLSGTCPSILKRAVQMSRASSDSLLQPNMRRRKSVTKITEKATTKANKYVLATHGIDSDGDFATKYVKVERKHGQFRVCQQKMSTSTQLFCVSGFPTCSNTLTLLCFSVVQGDIMATAGGGSAVVFTDVEKLKVTEPGVRCVCLPVRCVTRARPRSIRRVVCGIEPSFGVRQACVMMLKTASFGRCALSCVVTPWVYHPMGATPRTPSVEKVEGLGSVCSQTLEVEAAGFEQSQWRRAARTPSLGQSAGRRNDVLSLCSQTLEVEASAARGLRRGVDGHGGAHAHRCRVSREAQVSLAL